MLITIQIMREIRVINLFELNTNNSVPSEPKNIDYDEDLTITISKADKKKSNTNLISNKVSSHYVSKSKYLNMKERYYISFVSTLIL